MKWMGLFELRASAATLLLSSTDAEQRFLFRTESWDFDLRQKELLNAARHREVTAVQEAANASANTRHTRAAVFQKQVSVSVLSLLLHFVWALASVSGNSSNSKSGRVRETELRSLRRVWTSSVSSLHEGISKRAGGFQNWTRLRCVVQVADLLQSAV